MSNNKGGISMRKLDYNKKKGVEGGRKKRIRLPCGEVHGCRSRARWARVGPAAREGGAPVGDPADISTSILKRNCHAGLFTLVCHSSTQHQAVLIKEWLASNERASDEKEDEVFGRKALRNTWMRMRI